MSVVVQDEIRGKFVGALTNSVILSLYRLNRGSCSGDGRFNSEPASAARAVAVESGLQ